jgi:hypothetical protein
MSPRRTQPVPTHPPPILAGVREGHVRLALGHVEQDHPIDRPGLGSIPAQQVRACHQRPLALGHQRDRLPIGAVQRLDFPPEPCGRDEQGLLRLGGRVGKQLASGIDPSVGVPPDHEPVGDLKRRRRAHLELKPDATSTGCPTALYGMLALRRSETPWRIVANPMPVPPTTVAKMAATATGVNAFCTRRRALTSPALALPALAAMACTARALRAPATAAATRATGAGVTEIRAPAAVSQPTIRPPRPPSGGSAATTRAGRVGSGRRGGAPAPQPGPVAGRRSTGRTDD